ncbi:MAG: repressor LexA [Gammaproteobacteria bacterium]|nr:MAG: repressor LexA [Gammaproteobacteria bacterium]
MKTPIQHKIYEFIRQHIDERCYSPTLQEIAIGIGISPRSFSVISRNVHALVKAGYLAFNERYSRNIQLVSHTLPLVGRIAAGAPIEAVSENDSIDVISLLKGENHFVLEVVGESMKDEGILNGDLVICRRAEKAGEGEIVVALIDQREATLKRISYKLEEMITLIPANADLEPKAYLPHRIQVQGVFVGLVRLNR